jgi:hypothetical protein
LRGSGGSVSIQDLAAAADSVTSLFIARDFISRREFTSGIVIGGEKALADCSDVRQIQVA